MGRILVVGSLNMDMKLTMARMPVEGETVLGDSIVYNPGGKGANQAVAAGRLGGKVAMLGAVGRDDFGEALLANLSAAGVDVARMRRVEEPTGTAVIYVDAGGRNSIVVIPSANKACDLGYIQANEALIEQSDYLLLQMEIPHDSIWHAIRRGKALGKTVLLNPAPAPAAMPEDILPLLDWLTPNASELAANSGLPCGDLPQVEAAAGALLARGVGQVLVTVGRHGAMLVDKAGGRLFPVVDLPVVDTTAAGDCFNAAFTVRLAEGAAPQEAIEFANAAATISVTRAGAQSSLPTRAEVEGFLRLYPGGSRA